MLQTLDKTKSVVPNKSESSDLEKLVSVLGGVSSGEAYGKIQLANGEVFNLPPSLEKVLVSAAVALSEGKAVTIAPTSQILTTQQAADFLGMSRPTIVKLLENKMIPFETVGRHRRVKLLDVIKYQETRHKNFVQAMNDFYSTVDLEGIL